MSASRMGFLLESPHHDAMRIDELIEEDRRRAARLEAVRNVAGGMGHNFNNLLQAMIANLELIESDGPLTPEQREDIVEASGAVRRAAGLVAQLLDIAAPTARDVLPIDVATQLVATCTDAAKRFGDRMRLDTRLAAAPQCRISEAELDSVIRNLIDNAGEAMLDGGHVLVELVCVGPEPRMLHIIVHDDGSGIEPALLPNIFDPFVSTKHERAHRVASGAGFGLAVASAIVARRGGRIEISSRRGGGTAAHVYLPAEPRGANL